MESVMSNGWGEDPSEWMDDIFNAINKDAEIFPPVIAGDKEYDDLFAEFEKMLNGESNDYTQIGYDDPKPLSDEGKKAFSKYCDHKWEKTGTSPYTNEQWYNCVYCDIAKEKVEKKK